jgi:hypothetical protein
VGAFSTFLWQSNKANPGFSEADVSSFCNYFMLGRGRDVPACVLFVLMEDYGAVCGDMTGSNWILNKMVWKPGWGLRGIGGSGGRWWNPCYNIS